MRIFQDGNLVTPSSPSVGSYGTATTQASYNGGAACALKRLIAADFPYTIGAGDYELHVTTTAAARTINLPSAPAHGTRIVIKDASFAAGTNAITVARGGSDTIDSVVATGATSYVINTNGGIAVFAYSAKLSDGTAETKWTVE